MSKTGIQGGESHQLGCSRGARDQVAATRCATESARKNCLRVVRGAFSALEWSQLLPDEPFQRALAAVGGLDQAESVIRVGLARLDTQRRVEESAGRGSDLLRVIRIPLVDRLRQLSMARVKPGTDQPLATMAVVAGARCL